MRKMIYKDMVLFFSNPATSFTLGGLAFLYYVFRIFPGIAPMADILFVLVFTGATGSVVDTMDFKAGLWTLLPSLPVSRNQIVGGSLLVGCCFLAMALVMDCLLHLTLWLFLPAGIRPETPLPHIAHLFFAGFLLLLTMGYSLWVICRKGYNLKPAQSIADLSLVAILWFLIIPWGIVALDRGVAFPETVRAMRVAGMMDLAARLSFGKFLPLVAGFLILWLAIMYRAGLKALEKRDF